jgi:metal-responsive CopG/Arc/MetJ family transcriptional regulator
MSEENPFKSIKITLSEEALSRLDKIVKNASFRSSSSGIEECIRLVYDLIEEVHSTIGREKGTYRVDVQDEAQSFVRMATRMSRFTGVKRSSGYKPKGGNSSADT